MSLVCTVMDKICHKELDSDFTLFEVQEITPNGIVYKIAFFETGHNIWHKMYKGPFCSFFGYSN